MSYIGDTTLSYRAQIEELSVGESFSRAKRFDADEVTKEQIRLAIESLRMATQPTVHRIAKRTDYEYTIEQGEFRTASRDVVAIVVVTRVA